MDRRNFVCGLGGTTCHVPLKLVVFSSSNDDDDDDDDDVKFLLASNALYYKSASKRTVSAYS